MKFKKTKLEGVYVIELEKQEDERGFFARIWDKKIFDGYGINSRISQISISFNKKRGTIRGMHYQAFPYQETKVVRCVKGKIFDVIIDIRRNSKNFQKWLSVELSEDNKMAIYIAEGFAHGFQTLEDDTEVLYQISEFYREDYARGLRYDDPFFAIPWPIKNPIISKKDLSYKLLKEDPVKQ